MRKTTVIVALAMGATGAVAQPRLAAAQQPGAQPSPPVPAQPTEPATPPGEPREPAAAPPAADELPVPPGPRASPGQGAPAGNGGESGAEGNAPAPLGRTLFPSPSLDTDNLKKQGEQRPDARRDGTSVSLESIFAEDWWSHARPLFEFHGYFRTRSELFYNFALGRRDDPTQALYPQPVDNQYTSIAGNMTGNSVGPLLCTAGESDAPPQAQGPLRGCRSKTQAGANMRFRLSPTLHISDNLRIHTQIDMLDNLVLGSTPEGYAISPASVGGGYQVLPRSGYLPVGGLDQTQVPPTAGVNGLQNSIAVKRA
ncbi:MAG TPA: TIGR04551 family protein, partial [Polyangiaceae bacterium]|nr:TIGR04551 family protein [Polyangiaceae bacterium]